jgi:hypothetical protein
VAALNAGARASAYSALLPVAWHGYDLKPGFNQTDSNDVTTLVCDEPANYPSHRTPFASALPANQFHAATGFTSSGQRSEVWLFANTEPWTTGIDAWADMPTSSLTDNIYGPTSTGGAGAFQYGPAWWRSTYNPPGHATCGKGSGSLDVNQVWSQNYPPPNIAPPLP